MKLTFTILFTFLIVGQIKAQTEYTLTHSTGTYTELTNPTLINKVWDFEDAMIKLPFKFKYFKKDFDTIYVTMQSAFFQNREPIMIIYFMGLLIIFQRMMTLIYLQFHMQLQELLQIEF